jgi:uncharacterized protein YecE (DUF72 family)
MKELIKFYIGTSGYHNESWVDSYYHSTSHMLEKYAQDFNTVEINSTFYKLPSKDTVMNWNDATQNDFIYSIKVNKSITHYSKLNKISKKLLKFFSPFKDMKHKIGCFLFQFHKNFVYSETMFKRFVNLVFIEKQLKQKGYIDKNTRFVFEFRNKTFFNQNMYNLFKLNKWAFVVWHGVKEISMTDDKLKLSFFKKFIDSSDILYIRLHGTKDVYTGSYSQMDLQKITSFLKKYRMSFSKAYIYFNNVDEDLDAINDAKKLQKLLNWRG